MCIKFNWKNCHYQSWQNKDIKYKTEKRQSRPWGQHAFDGKGESEKNREECCICRKGENGSLMISVMRVTSRIKVIALVFCLRRQTFYRNTSVPGVYCSGQNYLIMKSYSPSYSFSAILWLDRLYGHTPMEEVIKWWLVYAVWWRLRRLVYAVLIPWRYQILSYTITSLPARRLTLGMYSYEAVWAWICFVPFHECQSWKRLGGPVRGII